MLTRRRHSYDTDQEVRVLLQHLTKAKCFYAQDALQVHLRFYYAQRGQVWSVSEPTARLSFAASPSCVLR